MITFFKSLKIEGLNIQLCPFGAPITQDTLED